MPFLDRVDAGQRLAGRLGHLRRRAVVVLGLPRGGVPVAAEVASVLRAPLDVIVVRKLGVPFQPELALGAIGEDGVLVRNLAVQHLAGVTDEQLDELERVERAQLVQMAGALRGSRTRLALDGRVAVVVDDGIATGATARAACQVARAHGAAAVVLAVPVAPLEATTALADAADEIIAVETPEHFFAVGQWYERFDQVSDEEVALLLGRRDHGEESEA